MHTGNQPVPVPVPVLEQTPSGLILNELTSLRDELNQLHSRITAQLKPVMLNCPAVTETECINYMGDLPPMFREYKDILEQANAAITDIHHQLDRVRI